MARLKRRIQLPLWVNSESFRDRHGAGEQSSTHEAYDQVCFHALWDGCAMVVCAPYSTLGHCSHGPERQAMFDPEKGRA
jgi:hypothetical protein